MPPVKPGKGKRSKARIGILPKRRSTATTVSIDTLQDIEDTIDRNKFFGDWVNCSKFTTGIITMAKMELLEAGAAKGRDRLIKVLTLSITQDRQYQLFALGRKVCWNDKSLPDTLTTKDLKCLNDALQNVTLCSGLSSSSFIQYLVRRKGVIMNKGTISANLDSTFEGGTTTKTYPQGSTVRSTKCTMLVQEGQKVCSECTRYRKSLSVMASRPTPCATKNMNWRYLATPVKRLNAERRRRQLLSRQRRIKKLEDHITRLVEGSKSQLQDEEVHEEIVNIIEEHDHQINQLGQDDIKRIFWNQQKKASQVKGSQGMRWHPLMIRLCLMLKYHSTVGYNTLRGILQLPSTRTLHDYTNHIKTRPGIQKAVLEHVYKPDLPESHKYLAISFDEIKIRESLVYHSYSGEFIGFTNLGSVNQEIEDLTSPKSQPDIATHILTFMARGIFTSQEFAIAHYPAKGLTSDKLYFMVWEVIKALESLGFKVMSLTCDGAASNRGFFKLHTNEDNQKHGVIYRTKNIYALDGRYVYFFSDVPHLIKTSRNCWLSSYKDGPRYMQRQGKYILWAHLHQLHQTAYNVSGLYATKLRMEHLKLTSYSKMRVDLAAQTLSETVAIGLEQFVGDAAIESATFCRMLNTFFDCLNTRSLREGYRKRNPNVEPYKSPFDERFSWLKDTFLHYLLTWEQEVNTKSGFTAGEREKMLLSRETRDGLKMTTFSFTELAPILLSVPGVQFLLSERFSQDSLENYFGRQRIRGSCCDNPNVDQYFNNVNTLRVVQELNLDIPGSNVRGRKRAPQQNIDIDAPLPRRSSTSKYTRQHTDKQ